MSNCIICGEETKLIVLGRVICVRCDDAEEREATRKRSEPPEPPRLVTSPDNNTGV